MGAAKSLLIERGLAGALEDDEKDGLHGDGRARGVGRFSEMWLDYAVLSMTLLAGELLYGEAGSSGVPDNPGTALG